MDMGSAARLAEGDFVSLRAGLSDERAGHALLSAMLQIGGDGPKILFQAT
jgi:hypothetical protein